MFAVQVRFLDSKEPPENVILRRLYATIGSRESCHLIIDGVDDLPWELRIRRGIGTRFFLQKVEIHGDKIVIKEECEYVTFGTVVFDDMEFFIYCIDTQVAKLYLNHSESQLDTIPPSFLTVSSELFPVLYCVSEPKVGLSICSLEKLYIGRSRSCLFRLEQKDLLAEHLEFTHVGHCWYVGPTSSESSFSLNGRSISEKSILKSGDRIVVGGSEILFLDSEIDLNRFSDEVGYSLSEKSSLRSGYLNIEEGPDAPKSIPLVENKAFTIGRDPSHSLWIDKYFISRLHCTIVPRADSLEITDFSSNGTSVNGRKLVKDNVSIFKESSIKIILGPGIKLRYVSGSSASNAVDNVSELDLEYDGVSSGVPEIEHKIIESIDSNTDSFADYQKKTIRQMEESSGNRAVSSPFLSETSMDNFTEVPIQIGLSRFLPQVFIGALILVLSIVFVLLARNIIL